MQKKTKDNLLFAVVFSVCLILVIMIGMRLSSDGGTEPPINGNNHPPQTGIHVHNDSTTISHKVLLDLDIGIVLWSSNNIIENCTFINCTDEGIYITQNSHNNTFINCVFYKCLDGVELQKSCNNMFNHCWFLSNTHAGVDAIRDNNNNNTFFSCVFYDNLMGAYFSQSQNNTFPDTLFVDNGEDKIGC